tara:strand:- start:376 stop:1467 length:1092 start_codon:yes stop_codon:yes gene_type:complete
MKFTIITPKLDISGVPLAQIRFANALNSRGNDVDLIVGWIDKNFEIKSYINEKINLINLNVTKTRWMIFGLAKYILKNNSRTIFSAEDHLNSIVLFILIILFRKNKVCCSSRVTPFDTYSNKVFSKKWFLKHFIKFVMWRANILSCVSKGMVNQYKSVFKNSRHICIHNIIYSPKSIEKSKIENLNISKSKSIKILAVGRLAKWKGFDVLINAVSLIVKQNYQIELYILGDGPERKNLQMLIYQKKLQNIIKLVGYVVNPYNYYSNCDIFVLSSYVEGMPNVLVEAMMLGCTPVSTDCDTGPTEIINHEYNGYLCKVGDVESMCEKIIMAINKKIDKDILDETAYKFSEELIINKYFNLLKLK